MAKSSPIDLRWKPPCPRPPIPNDLDPDLVKLLDTFWTADPVCPGDHAGPSEKHTGPPPTDSNQLLSLYRVLEAIDPKEAGRWHWRDGRKVRRGLERWWERGRADLPMDRDGTVDTGRSGRSGRRARFGTLIFWVFESIDTLRPRLINRVDGMVEVRASRETISVVDDELQIGLLKEIAEMRGIAERMYGSAKAIDHTEGIFQAIGTTRDLYTMKLMDNRLQGVRRPTAASTRPFDRSRLPTYAPANQATHLPIREIPAQVDPEAAFTRCSGS